MARVLRGLLLAAIVWFSGHGLALAEVRIFAGTLGRLPEGSVVHPSVGADRGVEGGAIVFSEGGIVLPTAGVLSAGAGAIDVRLCVPGDWPAAGDRALFHAASGSHQHVTLFFRDAGLIAVYKGGEAHFSSIRYPASGNWKPGEWHRVQFGWQGEGDEIQFALLVDDELAGVAEGRLLPKWPATCEVGQKSKASPWKGLIQGVELSERRIPIPGLEPGERTIMVHGDRETGECYPFWTVGNYNKPQEFLLPGYAKNARKSRPFVNQANAVYLLGGRYRGTNNWYQGVGPGGEVRADFSGMIAQLKAMVDGDFAPWPVLDNVPYEMSDPPQENTYGNTAPAKDVRVWGKYVEGAARAMVEAFGREAVARWWFRVGTEPDLTPGHWAGTREQYLEHYDHTVAALDRVIPEAKVGPGNILNPAGGEFGTATRKQWGLDIIDHAAAGTNRATGAIGTRMDWFSFSWYGRVGEPTSVFDDAVNAIRGRMARHPKFEGLPLIVGEFAVLHDEAGRRLWGGDTTEWGASFYAAIADRVYRHGILHVNEWAQTTSGVPHARANVIAMLQDMVGGRRLAVEVKATSRADCGAIACRKGEAIWVLVYNHRPLRKPKVPETVRLRIGDPRMKADASWRITEWLIDAEHGVWGRAFDADFEAAGHRRLPTGGRYEGALGFTYGHEGASLFRKNLAKYAKLAEVPKIRDNEPIAVAEGLCALKWEMPGHSVRMVRLEPPAGIE